MLFTCAYSCYSVLQKLFHCVIYRPSVSFLSYYSQCLVRFFLNDTNVFVLTSTVSIEVKSVYCLFFTFPIIYLFFIEPERNTNEHATNES